MAKTSQCTAFQFVPNSTVYICSVCKYEESNQWNQCSYMTQFVELGTCFMASNY